ncbi:MAG: quinone oxidoreductase [Kordiimonadaceae bacterium]|nr:quinone oxidoreductase [Kordiimonadaceae bacterium]MBO6568362.1 quinone oxidoreductase [Kordiimonadaceae bacterium]MBO6963909.1 quinone oxidoreductase [Kordiimonadaceae bacterium]
MTHAICFTKTGGPDVLQLTNVDLGPPKPGDVQIQHTAIGLNFIDTYHRSGLYPMPLPAVPGIEAAGFVAGVGEGVTDFKAGDRVGYPAGPPGAYSQARNMPADRLVKIPDSVTDQDAAALLTKGCTVEFLVQRLYEVKPGDTVLWHAAAGGVGLIACQWLSSIGVTVIGTVGSEKKGKIAKEHGCEHTILYEDEDFETAVMNITGGKGVPVVYDSVGAATFDKSLNCLARRGMMVTFGNATGPVPPVSPATLAQKGSLMLTRPSLMDYVAERDDLVSSASSVMAKIADGSIKANICQIYALQHAAQAHIALEARQTKGQTILTP